MRKYVKNKVSHWRKGNQQSGKIVKAFVFSVQQDSDNALTKKSKAQHRQKAERLKSKQIHLQEGIQRSWMHRGNATQELHSGSAVKSTTGKI